MLKLLRRSGANRNVAQRLCAETVTRARMPVFFARLAVPDTLDGRFDLVAFHVWLVLERLNGSASKGLAQAFIDEIFIGFDEALRQLGTGDIGMTRRLKTLASAFYGRLNAYRETATADDLAEAILRNVYRGAEDRRSEARAMADYAIESRVTLANCDPFIGKVNFAPLPDLPLA